MPPIAFLRERFYLCADGVLRYARNGAGFQRGDKAGHETRDGYRKIDVMHNGVRKKLAAHRVIWSLHNGRAVPDTRQVDHFDTDHANDHPSNLKARTVRNNQLNKKVKGCGVTACGTKFRSQISVNGRKIYLGVYETKDDAARAYKLALAGRHPKCTSIELRGA